MVLKQSFENQELNYHICLKKKSKVFWFLEYFLTGMGSTEEVKKPPESIRIKLPLQIRTYTEKWPLIMNESRKEKATNYTILI